MNLKLGVKNYKTVFRRLHRQGIAVLGPFIFGLESDTIDDLYRRDPYIRWSGVDAIQTTISRKSWLAKCPKWEDIIS